MNRVWRTIAAALIALPMAGAAALPVRAEGDKAAELAFNEFTVYRASPAAPYFTPGSLVMGWSYKGVLRLEMVCRNKVDLEADPDLLRAPVQALVFAGQSGFTFSAGADVPLVLNAEMGGRFVTDVTMTIDNVVIYEYSTEDLRDLRKKLLSRPSCREEARNLRFRYRQYNGAPAGLFQNQRLAIGDVTYTVAFNKDNPQALRADIQAQATKTLQVKFGLSYLNASQTQLSGSRIVVGVYPIWRNLWE